MVSPQLAALSAPDRELLEARLVRFDQSWNDQALASQAASLTELPEHVRAAALVEMVKIDLERQWQQGRRVTLASYLGQYPTLGTPESVSPELILAEYEIRRQFKVPVDLDEFAERFPRQEQELRKLVAKAEADRSQTSAAPMAKPPRADRDTSKAALSTDGVGKEQSKQKVPKKFGRYRIHKRLGEGGMGAVYLAHDTQLDRQVALKIPRFSAKKKREIVDRFLREARAAATIRHPNVCPVFDVGEIGGTHYLTMAYIEGRTLSEFIRPDKPLPERQVAAVVCKLALALQEAHDCGVVHRDLKPSNVMIDRRTEPVIMDFGLARRTDAEESRATQQGTILGTPAYMSPEQVLGEPDQIGPHTDVYSLGVILYELLTGKVPYQGNPTAVLGQILSADPPPPQEHRSDVDPKLAAICGRAMAKKQEERYGSMKDLAADLTEFLNHARRAPAKPTPNRPSKEAAQDSMEQAFANIAASGAQSVRRPAPNPLVHRLQQLAPLARRHRKILVAVAAGLLSFLFLWGLIISLQTPDGTLIVEIDDPDAIVEVVGDEGKVLVKGKGKDGQIVFSLDPGNRRVRVEKDGEEVFAQDVTIVSREEEKLQAIRARWEPSVSPAKPVNVTVPSPDRPPLAVAPFSAAQAKQHQQAWADYLGVPVERTVELPGGEKLAMVLIPPGEFMMGSTEEEQARFMKAAKAFGDEFEVEQIRCEGPPHRVRITRPFYLGKCEITQSQWQAVMGSNPSSSQDDPLLPVENVSWADIQPFLSKLNADLRQDMEFCLPTETQWEYACRAGTRTFWYVDEGGDAQQQYAWLAQTSDMKTHCVGQLQPNAFGLYDMHGNVWEWCADWHSEEYYAHSPADDPTGPPDGLDRIIRGECFHGAYSRSAGRRHCVPGHRWNNLGFRVLCEMAMEPAAPNRPVDVADSVPFVSFDTPTAALFPNPLLDTFSGDSDGISNRTIHDSPGALGSAEALRWSYQTKKGVWVQANIVLQGSREQFFDLTPYDSVSFYVKGTRPGSAGFMVHAKTISESDVRWSIFGFDYTNKWKKVTIDLEPEKLPNLDVHNVFEFGFGYMGSQDGDENVVWIDEIACHRKRVDVTSPSSDQPPLAVAPFGAAQAKQHQQAWADYLGVPVERDFDLPGGEKLTTVLIPPGEFMMGSTKQEQERFLKEAKMWAHDELADVRIPSEGPQHRVCITRPFYLGKYEVTQAQWQNVMGSNPANFQDHSSLPVENVSWADIRPFLHKLNADSEQGIKFGLPTEAQWEYACRAGTTTYWYVGDGEDALQEYAWLCQNSNDKTHRVGQLLPNAFDLYDMHGNVWEWCLDWYSEDYYSHSPVNDPQGPKEGAQRMIRGSSFQAGYCRSAVRHPGAPAHRWINLGFRVACEIPMAPENPTQPQADDMQVANLCRRAREDWLERRFAQADAPVLKEHFILYGASIDGKVPEFSTWDELVANSENLGQAIDEILPHPDEPAFDIQGPIALIRLPLAQCKAGGDTHLVDNLGVAVRQDGTWLSAAAVNGDWRLTADDRFDPEKEGHRSFQRFYEEFGNAILQKDKEVILRRLHSHYLSLKPNRNNEQVMLEGGKNLQFSTRKIDSKTTIHYVKVNGPIALVLKLIEYSIDGTPQPAVPSMELFCREQDQWQTCLWVPGDWENVLVDEPRQ